MIGKKQSMSVFTCGTFRKLVNFQKVETVYSELIFLFHESNISYAIKNK